MHWGHLNLLDPGAWCTEKFNYNYLWCLVLIKIFTICSELNVVFNLLTWDFCAVSLHDILVFRYNSGPTFNPSLSDFFACYIAARQTRQICWKVMACLTSTSCMIWGIIYVCQFMCRLKVHYTWQYLIMYSQSCRLRFIWFSFFCWIQTFFFVVVVLNNPSLWVNIMQVNGTIKASIKIHTTRPP